MPWWQEALAGEAPGAMGLGGEQAAVVELGVPPWPGVAEALGNRGGFHMLTGSSLMPAVLLPCLASLCGAFNFGSVSGAGMP